MSREDFVSSWLFESPQRNNIGTTYNFISNNIQELKQTGIQPIKISENLFKIELSSVVYYWYGSLDKVILGIELDKKSQSLVVNVVGKDPSYSGKPPYASDLYDAILKNNHNSICISSDEQLSDEGFNIWKTLFNLGHTVTAYDTTSPGQSRKTFNTADDMNQYFGDDPSFKNWRFIISESVPEKIGEVISHFNTRRMRELANIL